MNLKVNSCNMGTIGLKSPLTIVKDAIGPNHWILQHLEPLLQGIIQRYSFDIGNWQWWMAYPGVQKGCLGFALHKGDNILDHFERSNPHLKTRQLSFSCFTAVESRQIQALTLNMEVLIEGSCDKSAAPPNIAVGASSWTQHPLIDCSFRFPYIPLFALCYGIVWLIFIHSLAHPLIASPIPAHLVYIAVHKRSICFSVLFSAWAFAPIQCHSKTINIHGQHV